jgi:hypothetical protein
MLQKARRFWWAGHATGVRKWIKIMRNKKQNNLPYITCFL